VTVIAATSTPAAVAARAATTTIPVVFTTASDPVHLGLVSNLNRPGGNVTGATQLNVEVGPKRLELMRELIPSAIDVGLLLNPANVATGAVSTDQQAAASTLGLRLHVVHASSEREIDDAFAKLVQSRARALIISSDPFFNTRSEQFAALTLRYSMPSIHAYRAFAASGGLISYGGNLEGSYHTAGTYTGRILKGEKPGDLPVQQSTKIELFINLKTARALGLTIPPTLLARADEVIE
jgi:putative ABC transport system substrate-binding protein